MIAYDSNYAFANQHAFQRIIKLLEFVKTMHYRRSELLITLQ